MNVLYKDVIIEFEIIYKKRKTLCMEIDIEGHIRVISPIGISKEYIEKRVKDKAQWIIKKQKEMKSLGEKKITRRISDGETLMYLGIECKIKIIFKIGLKKINIKFIEDNESFLIITGTLDENKIKFEIEKWYRQKSLEKLMERVKYYEKYFDKRIKSVKVKEQKRRWASCTYDNRILFNWRNIMAPPKVFDYIVIHEMCHMDFKDHSKNFWNRVEEIMPDYKKYHNWLKENGIMMVLY